MPDFIKHLRSFNRKERFYLLQAALGEDTFSLAPGFRERLENELGLTVPRDAFVAMDYHLDWIALALYLSVTPDPPDRIPKAGSLAEVNKSQMDIDLLVAFNAGATTHIVLIEAKGDTDWDPRQLANKVRRLSEMFPDQVESAQVKARLVLVSPNPPPPRLETEAWPDWMKSNGGLIWMPLAWPQDLLKATRCDARGQNAESGAYLRLDPSPGNS